MKTSRLELLDEKNKCSAKVIHLTDNKPPKVLNDHDINNNIKDAKVDYVGEYFKDPCVSEEALLCYFREFRKEGGKSNYVKSFMRSVFETLDLQYTDYEEDVYYIYDKVCEELARRYVSLFEDSIDTKKTIDKEKLLEMINDGRYSEYYEEKAFKDKVRDFGSRLGSKVLYPAFLLFNILQDRDTPLEVRGVIVASLGYFICPVDIIPDIVPVLGMTDDIGVLTLGIELIKQHITQDIEDKTNRDLSKLFKSS